MENSENYLKTSTDLYKDKSQIEIVNQKLSQYFDKKSSHIQDLMQKEDIKEQDTQQIAQTMVKLQKITLEAHCIKKQVNNYNEKIVVNIQKKSPGIIQDIVKEFDQLQDGDLKLMGKEIINNCLPFNQVNHQRYKQLVKGFNKDKVLELTRQYRNNQKHTQLKDYKVLKNRFEEVKETYDITMEKYLKSLANFQKKKDILKQINKIIKSKKLDLDNWNDNCKKGTTEILGLIFAAWSLSEINPKDIKELTYQYREPNTAQILAILIILRCEIDQDIWDKIKNIYQNIPFDNQIIQILTGEGKSVIIGVISAFLAFLGYNVHAVCYSKYLSQRDQQDFKPLHEFLEVDKYIVYGTFQEISELNLLKDINIRDATLKLVDPNYQSNTTKIEYDFKRPTILFIDEIDVFFYEDFYGKTFNPIAKLQSEEIKDIFNLIWKEGKPSYLQEKCRYTFEELKQKIKNSKEYQNLVAKYQEWEQFMKSHIDEIINCMVNFSKQIHQIEYQVKNDKIGYKQTDHSLCFKTQYSYLTIFTYFYEHQNQNISKESLDEMVGIDLKCGYLSYAESPNICKYILGVTGTLETLHDDIKDLLEDYNIKSKAYIPSIFGASRIQGDVNDQLYFSVEQNYDQWLSKIVTILTTNEQCQKPVVIFFDSKKDLYKLYNNDLIQQFQNKFQLQILEENIKQEDKDQYIRRSTIQGYITFSTKEYGRGTDFICRDDRVNSNEGVKVIQTFLSLDISEEIQIRGRTGRQGMPGKYHLIINFEDLEKNYECQWQNIQQNKANLYKYLNGIRNQKQSDVIANYSKHIKDSEQLHKETLEYIDCLKRNKGKAKQILQKLNKPIQNYQNNINQHIIFILDRSGSMQGEPWEGVVSSMNQFVQQMLNTSKAENIVSIICYDNQAEIVTQYESTATVLQTFGQKESTLNWGGTNFSVGLQQAYDIFQNQSEKHKNFKAKILFLSDGGDWQGNNRNQVLDQILNNFQDQITSFWTMGFGSSVSSQALINMADKMKECGGEYKTALTVQEMENQFKEFALQKQYLQ